MVKIACLIVLLSAAAFAQEKLHYSGYAVLRAVPTTDRQLSLLRSFAEAPELETSGPKDVDFWLHPSKVNSPVDMMVAGDKILDLKKHLDNEKIPHVTIIDDVEEAVEAENQLPLDTLMTRAPRSFFTSYHRLNDIHNHLNDLAQRYPSIASTLSIGKSSEGRDLKAIKIGSPGNNKPIIWIDGGIHAREWISPATVTYILTQLVELYDSDTEIKNLVDRFDWYILPVTNPDGYEYTHTSNRMWRKTRSNTNSPWGCLGADPNRNFGFHWSEGGSSNNPCSDTYAGAKAFSEPETKAVADFLLARKGQVKSFLSVHSYSQLWLTPWGWTKAYPANYQEIKNAATIAVNALTKVHGTRYTIGSSTNVLYIASGGSDDWALGVAGIPYTYTLELRDTGSNGFVLPANQIIPTGQETWAGVKALAQYISKVV